MNPVHWVGQHPYQAAGAVFGVGVIAVLLLMPKHRSAAPQTVIAAGYDPGYNAAVGTLEQITIAERSIKVSKEAATGFEKLHAEVGLSLKILEATATRFAELKLQTVSAQSRMNVVDEARPPLKSRPGMLMTSLVSLFVALGSVLLWYALEYAVRSARLTAKRQPAIGVAAK